LKHIESPGYVDIFFMILVKYAQPWLCIYFF
jgi:hypothetical protein